jgi:hypothetical protein
MTKIYYLGLEQSEILDSLFWLDENEEEDAKEIEKLKKDLFRIRSDATNTLEFLSGILLESKAILEAREEAKRRAERRRKTAEKSVEKLTGVIEYIMRQFEIQKFSTDLCDCRLQYGPPGLQYAEGFNAMFLPTDCYKLEYKPIAAEIKKHIEAGEVIDGVELVRKESLRIG